ncbi:MAG: hypothetical protein F9K29_16675 [Hyphomicrobiaceae bacterium]|nr:MAG: hypothetical protein F9K29_16675 [Hyphomicrobiaceae bacterium]
MARPNTISLLWAIFGVILTTVVLADFLVEHHPLFGLDGTFGFAAWYGFASCIALVLFAKALGALLKRLDTYYND